MAVRTAGDVKNKKPISLFNKSAKDFVTSLCQGKQMSSKDIRELREYLDTLENKGE